MKLYQFCFSSLSDLKMNPDLARERSKASFNVQEMTYVLDGGRSKTERRRYLESLIAREPVFQKDADFFYGREAAYESSVKKGVRFLQIIKENKLLQLDNTEHTVLLRAVASNLPTRLHDAMAVPSIKALGTKEQQAKWLPLAESRQILTTYAQTELGHGTFIRGMETTATFDKTSQEFVMHSPTLTACKWWPGSLGHTVTHVILVARLLTDGQDCGIHFFIVQIRDLETHMPLPGIKVGDIGPKDSIRFNSLDNGFLMLKNVRIPREHMMMAMAKVSRDGKFSKSTNPENEKILYSIMLYIRSSLPRDAFFTLSRAITIAIRYGAVRRQSELKPGEGELQIIDYKTQQYKLLPGLAISYAIKFASRRVFEEYSKSKTMWAAGDYSCLQELHALSSSMKAYCTSQGLRHAETCRLACGGHGYSLFSFLPELYALLSAMCTYEGDNTVLFLQVARYLLKYVSKARSGATLPSTVSYLNGSGSDGPCTATKAEHFLDPHVQLKLYRDRSYRLINDATDRMQAKVMSGMDPMDAWNEQSADLVRCATAHSAYLVAVYFMDALRTDLSGASKEVLSALKSMSDLNALYGIMNDSGSFLETGVLTVTQVSLVRDQVSSLFEKIRPDAVALVDAFDYSDFLLNSALGRYNGDVYQRLYELAQKSQLNRQPVLPAYKYLKQIMNGHKAKL